jgi:hypothetical protein
MLRLEDNRGYLEKEHETWYRPTELFLVKCQVDEILSVRSVFEKGLENESCQTDGLVCSANGETTKLRKLSYLLQRTIKKTVFVNVYVKTCHFDSSRVILQSILDLLVVFYFIKNRRFRRWIQSNFFCRRYISKRV